MEAAGVDPEKFPAIEKSATVVGEVTREASAQCGLPMGTPVVLGSGDGGAGRVGTGVVKPGRSYSSLGTSAWVSVCTEQPVFDAKERVVNVVNADPEYVTVSGDDAGLRGLHQLDAGKPLPGRNCHGQRDGNQQI